MPPKATPRSAQDQELLADIKETLDSLKAVIHPPESKTVREFLIKLKTGQVMINDAIESIYNLYGISPSQQWGDDEKAIENTNN